MTDDLVGELEHLKAIHAANLGDVALSPLDLLNSLHTLKLDVIPANLLHASSYCGSTRTFVQHSRTSKKLAQINNVSRSAKQLRNFSCGGPSAWRGQSTVIA